MSNNKSNNHSRVSLINAPKPVKKIETNSKKLGLLYKKSTISKTFRIKPETLELLQDIQGKLSKNLNIKIAQAKLIDILIFEAAKWETSRIIELLKK